MPLLKHNCRYLLSTTAWIPLYGRLCSLVGRRTAGQSATFLASIGAVICGISGTQILERIRNGGCGNIRLEEISERSIFQMGRMGWLILGRFVRPFAEGSVFKLLIHYIQISGIGSAGIHATSA